MSTFYLQGLVLNLQSLTYLGMHTYFFKDRVTEGGRDRVRSSIYWFTPQMVAIAGAAPIQSQELLPGLPRGYRDPRTWANFYYFPRL